MASAPSFLPPSPCPLTPKTNPSRVACSIPPGASCPNASVRDLDASAGEREEEVRLPEGLAKGASF